MMIDIEPLIPLLDAAKKAKQEIIASDAEFDALSEREQLARVNDFLARDAEAIKDYDDACRQVVAALHEAVINYGN